MEQRRRILTFVSYYLPGYKAGGALRTVAAMVDRLGTRLDFRIVCLDRDDGDQRPYPGVAVGRWTQLGNAQVYYVPPARWGFACIRESIRAVTPDVVYLNSVFAPISVRYVLARRMRRLPPLPVVLAPRGELAPGALGLKTRKKRAYLQLARMMRLYDGVRWQASSSAEAAEIAAVFPTAKDIRVAADLSPLPVADRKPKPLKLPGAARLVFCSRIAAKKNLHFIFPLLAEVGGEWELDVYGPSSEIEYEQECRAAAKVAGQEEVVRFCGPLPHDQVVPTLSGYHFFILPTLGENFGHVLLEALNAGCPPLVSDRTPWRNLAAQGVGWDLPLEDRSRWQAALRTALAMTQQEYSRWSQCARDLGRAHAASPPLPENAALFDVDWQQ